MEQEKFIYLAKNDEWDSLFTRRDTEPKGLLAIEHLRLWAEYMPECFKSNLDKAEYRKQLLKDRWTINWINKLYSRIEKYFGKRPNINNACELESKINNSEIKEIKELKDIINIFTIKNNLRDYYTLCNGTNNPELEEEYEKFFYKNFFYDYEYDYHEVEKSKLIENGPFVYSEDEQEYYKNRYFIANYAKYKISPKELDYCIRLFNGKCFLRLSEGLEINEIDNFFLKSYYRYYFIHEPQSEYVYSINELIKGANYAYYDKKKLDKAAREIETDIAIRSIRLC